MDADIQWANDVAGGWLTYYNDMADHSQTYANASTAAALALTDALATNAHTFATTVTPAIRAQAEAEGANGLQAIQTVASAGEGYANTLAANALAAKTAGISALEAANNAMAGVTQAQVSADAAALATLVIAQNAAIAQLAQAVPPIDASKSDFDAKLNELVEKAGISGKINAKELYEADIIDIDFDCDDFADAMQRFLNSKFSKNDGVAISILVVQWQKNTGPPNDPIIKNVGHAMLIVQHGGQYWYVDPTLGNVGGPYASAEACHAAVQAYIPGAYPTAIPASVTIGGTYAGHGDLPGEQQPWYKSNEMRQKFLDYCRKHKIDPAPFFPPGEYTPPQPRGLWDYWGGRHVW